MKIKNTETPDKWRITEYVYSYRTKLEKHIIDFCYQLLKDKGSLTLDQIIAKIEQERIEYLKSNKRAGELYIKKRLAGKVMYNPPVLFYCCSIRSNARSASLVISEPIP